MYSMYGIVCNRWCKSEMTSHVQGRNELEALEPEDEADQLPLIAPVDQHEDQREDEYLFCSGGFRGVHGFVVVVLEGSV
jgi:hypothetical protein